MFSTAAPFYILTGNQISRHPGPHFSVYLIKSHSNGYKMVSHCGFDLNSLMINDVEYFSMCLLAICLYS